MEKEYIYIYTKMEEDYPSKIKMTGVLYWVWRGEKISPTLCFTNKKKQFLPIQFCMINLNEVRLRRVSMTRWLSGVGQTTPVG